MKCLKRWVWYFLVGFQKDWKRSSHLADCAHAHVLHVQLQLPVLLHKKDFSLGPLRTLIWTSPNKTNGWSYASVTDCQSGPARETSDKLHRCSTIPPNGTTLSASQVLLGPQPQARAHMTGGFLHHLVLLRCSHRNWSCPRCRTWGTRSRRPRPRWSSQSLWWQWQWRWFLLLMWKTRSKLSNWLWKWKNHCDRKVTCSLSDMQYQNMFCLVFHLAW